MCQQNKVISGPDNGLLPNGHLAIIWTSADLFLNGSLETNFNEIFIKIFFVPENHLKNVGCKMSAISLNVLSKRDDLNQHLV